MAFDRTHGTIVKPASAEDDVHKFARARISEVLHALPSPVWCSGPAGVSVHIERTSVVRAGCRKGARFLEEDYVDRLRFTAPIACYRAQVMRDPLARHEVAIKYQAGTVETTPALAWTRIFGGPESAEVPIPVAGSTLAITYQWRQQPPRSDDDFGVGVLSSLPIASFMSSTSLPAGKRVLDFDASGNKASLVARFKEAGCTLDVGNPAVVKCSQGPVTQAPNKMLIVPWKWDVFAGC